MVAISIRRTTRATHQADDPASFAAYMRHHPEPLDGVERVLLRLDWLRGRLAHRQSA